MFEVSVKYPVFKSDNMQEIEKTIATITCKHSKGIDTITKELEGNFMNSEDNEVVKRVLDVFFEENFKEKKAENDIENLNTKIRNQTKEIEDIKTYLDKVKSVSEVIMKTVVFAKDLNEEQKEIIFNSYDGFEIGKKYDQGDVFKFDGKLYEVLQNHISQSDWFPEDTPSLYKEVLNIKDKIPIEDLENAETTEEEVE
ncbi:carbohydrate-binding protein [Facklamia sp. P12934]|uniref:carbohydrate-binding protein n=1 Tax=Facklamia sp. P12934 TaxID=3421948 RepID=UPI003D184450